MGFWSNLFGASPLGRDDFAAAIQERVLLHDPSVAITYDAESFCLKLQELGDSHQHLAFLTNHYGEYERVAKGERQQLLDRVAAIVSASGGSISSDFAEVAGDLLPIVRPRTYGLAVEQALRSQGQEYSDDVSSQPIGGRLGLGIAVDYPDRLAHCTVKQLEAWEWTFEATLRLATANLRNRSREPFEAMASGVFLGPWRDAYDASRMACPDLFRALPLRGDPVVLCPTRICILVTGSEDAAGLDYALKLAVEAREEDRPLSMVPLRLHADNTWREFRPDEALGLNAYRVHRLMELSSDYELQKSVHELRDDEDVFMATYNLFQRGEKEDGAPNVMSMCQWTYEVDTLLPVTDEVALFLPDSNVMARTSLAALLEHAPDQLVAEPNMYPPRYRTIDFPSDNELAAMGTAYESIDG